MMRFDRFTERAQDAIARSQEILQRYGHSQLDTEHLLMAMVEQPEGVITEILTRLDVNIDTLTGRLDELLGSSRSGYQHRHRAHADPAVRHSSTEPTHARGGRGGQAAGR